MARGGALLIMGLDLATACGFAVGRPGEIPRAGTVLLKRRGLDRAVALSNLVAWLQDAWVEERPNLVVTEAPMHLSAWLKVGSSEDNVRLQLGLHAVVEALCARYGISHHEETPQTIRKHFIGRANLGDRKATKGAVIQRCHLLGYMPAECRDDNTADACAAWDWAASTFGKVRPREIHLFGEGQAA